ncbi:MAG: DMT family transporter [Betaproteobacteria bacterium]|nr:DMT family transporter [Betaproteobacteria bacterium]
MASKEKLLAVSGLLSGAIIWGVIWYPYRLLEQMGVSGALSSLITYLIPVLLGFMLYSERVRLRHFPPILLLIGLTSGWTNLAYVLAVIHGEVMRVLLLFYLSPLWTVLLARLILHERLRFHGYLVMVLSFSGAVVMLWRPSLGMPLPQNAAEWLALSAGLMFAATNVLSRHAAESDIWLKSLSVWIGVAVLSLLALAWQPATLAVLPALPISGWGWLLTISILIFIVTLTVQYGLARTPANQAIVIFLFELVVAAVTSYLLAGEVMTAQEWVGGVMIVAASLFSGKLEEHSA